MKAVLAESAVFDEIGVQKNRNFRPIFWPIFGGFFGVSPNKRETPKWFREPLCDSENC